MKYLLLALCMITRSVFSYSIPSRRVDWKPIYAPVDNRNQGHEFWGQERTKDEVKRHVERSLRGIDAETNEHVSILSVEPPLVLIRDFLSTSMCDEIIGTALSSGDMKRSTTGEEQKASSQRTSSTTWLQEQQCEHPLRLLAEKVSRISGLPTENLENLQVCRYRPGQEFRLHTDHQDSFNDLEVGGRLATCLIYLSEPEKGGATWFPGVSDDDEGLTIAAERGSAVFFWNTIEKPGVTDYNPEMFLNTDLRMRHAGLPVEEGTKWICNRWVHPLDFGAGIRGLD